MFTGLIEKTGVLTGRESGAKAGRLTVKPDTPWTDLEEGESIAVNGACLTFEKESAGALVFFVMKETLDHTNLGRIPVGARVNLERALSLGSRPVLGGPDPDALSEAVSLERMKITPLGCDWQVEAYPAYPEI